MKDVAQEQYTQAEAERGAGMSKEKYPPAHPVKGAPAPSAAPAPGSTMESRVMAVGGGDAEDNKGGRSRTEEVAAASALSMDVAGEEDDDPDL